MSLCSQKHVTVLKQTSQRRIFLSNTINYHDLKSMCSAYTVKCTAYSVHTKIHNFWSPSSILIWIWKNLILRKALWPKPSLLIFDLTESYSRSNPDLNPSNQASSSLGSGRGDMLGEFIVNAENNFIIKEFKSFDEENENSRKLQT